MTTEALTSAMTLAIDTRDARLIGQVVDRLRGRGKTYAQILKLAQAVRPWITAAEWDEFMAEADAAESACEARR